MSIGDYLRSAFARLYLRGVYEGLPTDPRDAAIHLASQAVPPEQIAKVLRRMGVTPEQARVSVAGLERTIGETQGDDFLEGAWNANAERVRARLALLKIADGA